MLGRPGLPTEGKEQGVVHREQRQLRSTAWQTLELAACAHPEGCRTTRPVENVTRMFL